MDFIDIVNLSRKEKKVAREIDKYRIFYNSIKLINYYEPIMLNSIDNTKKTDKMSTIISEPDDINCWINGLSQSCVVKMKYLENSMITLLNSGDLYSTAILIRHHMELAGLICLCLEVLLEALKDKDYMKFQRFISKTFFGAAFYNNPVLRESESAFFRTETPTISAMIRALDNFLKANSASEIYDSVFAHNYAFLCQFSHPCSDTSSFFTDFEKIDKGHMIQFRWQPDYGKTGFFVMLNALKQNLQFGLASFYLFTAYHFTHDGIYVDKSNVDISYEILSGKKPED
ncbi:MAG: hypothetical protein H6Q64_1914 [Firmicutes bacterium]|nr:hypothetical protein [Bacillota bacterium]